jgi:hypothetical protein
MRYGKAELENLQKDKQELQELLAKIIQETEDQEDEIIDMILIIDKIILEAKRDVETTAEQNHFLQIQKILNI